MDPKKCDWSRPYHGVTHFTPIGRSTILSAPWCTVSVYSPTFSQLSTNLPMPAGMFKEEDGTEWYRDRHLKHEESHFDTFEEARKAAESWIRKQR